MFQIKIWKTKAIPSALHLTWKMELNIMSTKDILRDRGIKQKLANCVFYVQSGEIN